MSEENYKKLLDKLDDIWKMNDATFYVEIIKPLYAEIKESTENGYTTFKLKKPLNLSKNQKKSLQERLRRYRENLKQTVTNNNTLIAMLISTIAVLVSIFIYYISFIKGYSKEASELNERMKELNDNKLVTDKEKLESLKKDVTEIYDAFEFEVSVFWVLVILIAVPFVSMLYTSMNIGLKSKKVDYIDLAIRNK